MDRIRLRPLRKASLGFNSNLIASIEESSPGSDGDSEEEYSDIDDDDGVPGDVFMSNSNGNLDMGRERRKAGLRHANDIEKYLRRPSESTKTNIECMNV